MRGILEIPTGKQTTRDIPYDLLVEVRFLITLQPTQALGCYRL